LFFSELTSAFTVPNVCIFFAGYSEKIRGWRSYFLWKNSGLPMLHGIAGGGVGYVKNLTDEYLIQIVKLQKFV